METGIPIKQGECSVVLLVKIPRNYMRVNFNEKTLQEMQRVLDKSRQSRAKSRGIRCANLSYF